MNSLKENKENSECNVQFQKINVLIIPPIDAEK